ncbi:MAG: hypothetical protein ACUVQ8_03320 [Nitrososphaeria archaeon]
MVTVASFFNPNWVDLGVLGSFGRLFDVNWVWAEILTIYHSVFSITIPIVLAELAYPGSEDTFWINNRWFKGTIILSVGAVVMEFSLLSYLTKYTPPILQYLTAATIVLLIVYLSSRRPT